jgi:PD-(D/E)XK endonuclease
MKKRVPKIGNKKLRGEWAEMRFMVRVAELGLPISKPWGEMRAFDFVVGRPQHFVAVQVKSTIYEADGGYQLTVRSGHQCYPPGSFDFLAAYVVLENSWYLIPAEQILGLDILTLYSNSRRSKYERYREAWHLLQRATEPRGDPVDTILACEEEFSSACLQ